MVRKLMELRPSLAITGHGSPMKGEELTYQLEKLAVDFERLTVPDQGKYVH